MGFFSQECHECKESVVSPYDIPAGMEWQNEGVAITPMGNIITGFYNGYGVLSDDPMGDGSDAYHIGGENTIYHRRCWEKAGKPMEYLGASPHAGDQGFFYERLGSKA